MKTEDYLRRMENLHKIRNTDLLHPAVSGAWKAYRDLHRGQELRLEVTQAVSLSRETHDTGIMDQIPEDVRIPIAENAVGSWSGCPYVRWKSAWLLQDGRVFLPEWEVLEPGRLGNVEFSPDMDLSQFRQTCARMSILNTKDFKALEAQFRTVRDEWAAMQEDFYARLDEATAEILSEQEEAER